MFVKPKDGRSVPDPARGDVLPESGRNVEGNVYWYRRLNDGDVEIVDRKKKETETSEVSQ
ncbi:MULTISPECIES: DUF2635 domain-containing protein [Lonsdalea]|jgi:hypothetical protein|uniref:Uncharacterized protein n=2 Tax=Lonsdalea TaxID=1082702 RepID=A0ACD1JFT6_9GAMM|nr:MULTISPECIES: DUF2635 domain-containing protein [Lonsdalea]OSN08354.1 hypothetical protein AU510_04305 [Lonsdalea britannica]RAT16183.1 hypothetical protein AU485_01855 [Lonsdalea quercina]RAT23898.1 hypothetical protein AU487_00700 [Lonsdalea populi]RAT25433.1 hypothetical protein AU489_06955 [Lonsdalea populi]RAT28511.1 hypothetical protein AU488_00605 [Lonsdalea populi]